MVIRSELRPVLVAAVAMAALLVPGSAAAGTADLTPVLTGRSATGNGAAAHVLALTDGCRGGLGDVVCVGELRTE